MKKSDTRPFFSFISYNVIQNPTSIESTHPCFKLAAIFVRVLYCSLGFRDVGPPCYLVSLSVIMIVELYETNPGDSIPFVVCSVPLGYINAFYSVLLRVFRFSVETNISELNIIDW